jgi:hypothetical protein
MIASKMLTAAMAIALGLTLQGCNSTEKTTGSISVSASDGVAEAARLIRTLDISTHLQESARNYAAKQVSLGIAPKPALEQWIAEQRDRGAVICSGGIDQSFASQRRAAGIKALCRNIVGGVV